MDHRYLEAVGFAPIGLPWRVLHIQVHSLLARSGPGSIGVMEYWIAFTGCSIHEPVLYEGINGLYPILPVNLFSFLKGPAHI